MTFKEPIEFPANLMDKINKSRYNNQEIIGLYMNSEDADEDDYNLEDWEVTAITSTDIEFKLTFKDPI